MSMRWWMSSCRKQRQTLCLLACGALPESARATVEAHLAACPECRRYYSDMIALSSQFRGWAGAEPAIEVGAALRRRWTQAVQAGPGSAEGDVTAAVRWREWLWPSPAAWGVVVALWVCIFLLHIATPAQVAPVAGADRRAGGGQAILLRTRQRELTLLLDSLAAEPARAKPAEGRPLSRRGVEWLHGVRNDGAGVGRAA